MVFDAFLVVFKSVFGGFLIDFNRVDGFWWFLVVFLGFDVPFARTVGRAG